MDAQTLNTASRTLALAFRKVADDLEASWDRKVGFGDVSHYVALDGGYDDRLHWRTAYSALDGGASVELLAGAVTLFDATV